MEYEPERSSSEMKNSEIKVANWKWKMWVSLGAELTGSQGVISVCFQRENRGNTKKEREARRALNDLETPCGRPKKRA